MGDNLTGQGGQGQDSDAGYIQPKDKPTQDAMSADAKEKYDVKIWLDRIAHSEQYRKKTAEFYRWRQLLEEYRGRFYALMQSTDIYVPMINLIYAFIKSEIPALYIQDPKISVNPKKGSTALGAKILEKALNYYWQCKRIKRENKKNLLDNMTVGHSWFKTGYVGKFGTIEEADKIREFIESEDIFAYRVPWDSITFNPDANDPPFDCRWIAHQIWLPLEDVKKDKGYKHTDTITAADRDQETIWMNEIDDKLRYDPRTDMVSLYEVWDKVTKTKFIISKQSEYYLKKPSKWPYQLKGFPFSFLRLNDDPRNPYGIPDCFMFEQTVIELMKLSAQKMDHVKRFNRQLLSRKGALDETAKSQFQNSITGGVIEADIDSNESINNVITPIPYPPLQTDIYNLEASLKDYLVLISGKPYTEFGGKQDTSTRTVRELAEMGKGAGDRRAEKIDTVENFVMDISLNLISLFQTFLDLPFYIKLTDEDPQAVVEALKKRPSAQKYPDQSVTSKEGFTFTKDDILGDFDISVVPGSTTPLDSEKRNQLLTQILQILPNLGAIPGGPVTQLIATELADNYDLPELEQAIKQEIQLAQQMKQEQEQKAAEQQQLMQAQQAAELQMKGEQHATKQQQVLVDTVKAMHEMSMPPEQPNNA